MTELSDQLISLCKRVQQGMGSSLWRRDLRLILAFHNTITDHTQDLEITKTMIERYNKNDGLLLSDIWDYINTRLNDIKEDKGTNMFGVLEEVTDRIADVLANMDSKISFDSNPEAYKTMHMNLDDIQQRLLQVIGYDPSEE